MSPEICVIVWGTPSFHCHKYLSPTFANIYSPMGITINQFNLCDYSPNMHSF